MHSWSFSGEVRWRLEFRQMSSPAARLLLGEVGDPGGTFALFGRVGRSPRVFATQDTEAFLRQMQAAALNKMGITLAGGLPTWSDQRTYPMLLFILL